MRGIRRGWLAATLAAILVVPGAAAPPAIGSRIKPLDATAAKLGPIRPIGIDPSLLDVQMAFDFRHAVTQNGGVTLAFPGPPTDTAQGAILTLFSRGIVWPEAGKPASAVRMVYSATDQRATADFRSNAFDLAKRRAIVLDWHGYFEPVDFPIQIKLSVGAGPAIGAVTFDKGKVLVGPAGQETAIGAYAATTTKGAHHLQIRADLVARTYSVRFEQAGQSVTAPELAFAAGMPALQPGLQQVTARLTSPKPYVSGYYDLSHLTLRGEALP